MCGIAGILDRTGRVSPLDARRVVAAMTERLRHRGPDGFGLWTESGPDVLTLGHRRLSVIDLSETGRQPMASSCGRFVVTFNGEIYNFQDLRRELEAAGRSFRGGSDTEVLVEACAEWGLARAARRLCGMFAFALWDRRERTLSLARDQIGVKPLYWAQQGAHFAFASELSALAADAWLKPEMDRDALAAYLRFGYVPTPRTIYSVAAKLPPGCLLTLAPGREVAIEPYWDVVAVAGAGLSAPERGDEEALLEELARRLQASVARQMIADVPLGAFLSGGTDSSLTVALMQALSARPVKTFTIGFPERSHDEAPYARAVAAHLGTEHAELYVGDQQVQAAALRMPGLMDEPFADASLVATTLLCELARREVTVALSGDGGDEIFAGYDHYRKLDGLWRHVRRIPHPLRRALAAGVAAAPSAALHRLERPADAPGRTSLTDRILRAADVLPAATDEELYRRRYAHWGDPERVVRGGREFRGRFWEDRRTEVPGFVERMQLLDQTTYLLDNGLTKVDRASMSVALEVRVPLLDHTLVEYAWRLPRHLKISGATGKAALRRILHRRVPRHLLDRPRQGFNPPVAAWLRGPLRDWAESLLARDRLRDEGMFDPAPVRALWDRFQRGADTPWDVKRLWDVVMFEAWFEQRRQHTPAAHHVEAAS
jgi:asparagine synthase (glutamine-hydrolysing)